MSGPGDIEVHARDLHDIAGVLDDAGGALFARAADLRLTPDAGASSGEVATALASLAGAVAGLAEHLGSLAEATRTVSADFTGTDQGVGGRFDHGRGVLGP